MKKGGIFDYNTLTDKKTQRKNSQYCVGGNLARVIALQDIKKYCFENKKFNYLRYININPKTFIKNFVIVKKTPFFLSNNAIQYLLEFELRQKNLRCSTVRTNE